MVDLTLVYSGVVGGPVLQVIHFILSFISCFFRSMVQLIYGKHTHRYEDLT